MKSFADQFTSIKNRYRDSNVMSVPTYTSVGVGAMSVYKSTVLPICSQATTAAAAAVCSTETSDDDSLTDLPTGDSVVAILPNKSDDTFENNPAINSNYNNDTLVVGGLSSDCHNKSFPVPTGLSVSTMGQLQSYNRNNSFLYNNDNNNNTDNNSTPASNVTIEKRAQVYGLPSSTLPNHQHISAHGLNSRESSVDNDYSCKVSPEQSMEKEFELDKNINIVKPCSSMNVYLVDKTKVQYAEGDFDSAEEVMEDSKFSSNKRNTDCSTTVSPSSVNSSRNSLNSLDGDKECTSLNEEDNLYTSAYSNNPITVPIIGYETMEQRARFTVFKLQVIHSPHDSWFVFRRYTDFVQLSDKLKNIFPTFLIPLPPKRWFGDNFDRHFLEDRQRGLQDFINRILRNKILCECSPVREFFCFDDPPGPHDSLEESRALCESLEEQTYNLKKELKDKEHEIDLLKAELNLCKSQIGDLKKFEKLQISSKSSDLGLSPPSRNCSGSEHLLNECPEVDQNNFDQQVEGISQ